MMSRGGARARQLHDLNRQPIAQREGINLPIIIIIISEINKSARMNMAGKLKRDLSSTKPAFAHK